MEEKRVKVPDHTAVRVALWRALHVQVDPSPHVLEDSIGLKLAAPGEDWRERPDMNPQFTKRFRASIVARARFIEDLAVEKNRDGVNQYVILGAGLDTFAQRRPEAAARLQIFEIDQPETQAWKKRRLTELGIGIQENLHFVPVDFEVTKSWMAQLKTSGFDAEKPAVIASTGVSMYLTKEAIAATMREISALAPQSTFAMSFLLPIELMDADERPGFEIAQRGAKAGGTPFLSFFARDEILEFARANGFSDAKVVSGDDLANRYFAGRTDGLRPSNSEQLLVATV